MKKLIYFLSMTVLLSAMVSSCTKVDLPYETFNDLEKGAFARKIKDFSGSFIFGQEATSEVTFGVEFYDENNGNTVESYTWKVRFNPVVTGGDVSDWVDVPSAQFQKGSFVMSDTGLPSVDVAISFNEVVSALGLVSGGWTGGDEFNFEGVITTPSNTFGSGNTGSNIFSSSTFATVFAFKQPIICLSDLGGVFATSSTWTEYYGSSETHTYDETFATVDGSGDALEPGQYLISDLSGNMEPSFWGNPPVEAILIDVCGVLQLNETAFSYLYDYDVLAGSVVNADGSLTVIWENAFGENGVNTYTPK